MDLFTKQNRLTGIKNKLWLPKGKCGGEEINQELEINILTVLYIREITNKGLLYGTGNSTQYSVITHMRKEYEKE